MGKSDISAKLCSHYDIKVIEVYENIRLHNGTFQALQANIKSIIEPFFRHLASEVLPVAMLKMRLFRRHVVVQDTSNT